MSFIELFLLLSACVGLSIQIVHATIFDKLGIRPFLHKCQFIKELTSCSLCFGAWSGMYGLFCIMVNWYYPFLFLVLTVPFATSFWSFFFERFIIHKDEQILKLEKERKMKIDTFDQRMKDLEKIDEEIDILMKYKPEQLEYFLVQPLPHGNGGWYGYKTIAKGTLDFFLRINPYEVFKYELAYTYDVWSNSSVRICTTENTNDSLYIWDYEENKWEQVL